jgi:RimJ/RimL family protein N-acetyltransferase
VNAGFDRCEVALRRLVADDLEMLREWRNGDRVRMRMFRRTPISLEEHAAWWKRISADPGYAQFVLRYAGRPLGAISFAARDPFLGDADCGYYVGPDDAPRGAGTLLLHAGLAAAFCELRLCEVRCEIFEDNEPSLRLVRRFAFEERPPVRPGVRAFSLTAARFAAAEPRVSATLFAEEPHALR